MVITTGWAFAVMAGVFAAIACGTLGFAISSGDYSKLIYYVPAQMLGAFVGAALVWLHFLPHWKETADVSSKAGRILHRVGDSQFRREPRQRSHWHIRACVCFRRCVLKDGRARRPRCRPWTPPCRLCGLGHRSFAGRHHRLRINPARDLGPRIAHAVLPIAGKGSSDWNYAGIPVVGPLVGASLAGLLLHALRF